VVQVVQWFRPSRPRQLWFLLNHLLNLSGGSVALFGGSLPASENNPFLSGGSKCLFVVQWWFTFLKKTL
jgi:hypothetical protein